MAVDNCKRCKKVFRKTHSPFCAECLQSEMQSFDKVYQYLSKRGGQDYIHLSEIVDHCGISLKEAEELFFSGKLGLAGSRIAFNCQICDAPINKFMSDKKRLCPACATTVEVEGKLYETVDDNKPKAQEQPRPKIAPPKESPKESAPAARESDSKQYGFKRLSP